MKRGPKVAIRRWKSRQSRRVRTSVPWGVKGAQLREIRQAGPAHGRIPHGGGARLRPENVRGGVQHSRIGDSIRRAGGGKRGKAALCRGQTAEAPGQALGIGQRAALPPGAAMDENGIQKIETLTAEQQLQIKGPVPAPDAVRQEADAGLHKKGPPDAVFLHRPAPGGVQRLQPGGVVGAVKRAGHKAQVLRFGQGAVRLPYAVAADEPVTLRVGGQGGAQSLQQAGGHRIVTVKKEHPVAGGGLQPGVAGRGRTGVRLMQHLQAGNFRRQCVTNRAGEVGGAVINQQALPVPRAGLLRHTFETGGQMVLHVIDRDDNGKLGHGRTPYRSAAELHQCHADGFLQQKAIVIYARFSFGSAGSAPARRCSATENAR